MLDHLLLVAMPLQHPSMLPEGKNALEDLDAVGLAAAILYEFRLDRFRIFNPSDVSQLSQRLQQADWISGYNIVGYDLPLIAGMTRTAYKSSGICRVLRGRCNDLCERISLALNRDPDTWPDVCKSWLLADLARGTIEVERAGNGIQDATMYWQRNDWGPALSYGLDDAALIRAIIVFVEKHGYLIHGGTGAKLSLRRTSPRSPFTDMDPVRMHGQPDPEDSATGV